MKNQLKSRLMEQLARPDAPPASWALLEDGWRIAYVARLPSGDLRFGFVLTVEGAFRKIEREFEQYRKREAEAMLRHRPRRQEIIDDVVNQDHERETWEDGMGY
ncbi:MAG: hypothetical protein AB7O86_05940 [Porticoccaceae bacterium]